MFLKYLVMKRGFDPEDPVDFKRAIDIWLDPKKTDSRILPPDLRSDKYFCEISSSLVPN